MYSEVIIAQSICFLKLNCKLVCNSDLRTRIIYFLIRLLVRRESGDEDKFMYSETTITQPIYIKTETNSGCILIIYAHKFWNVRYGFPE